MGVQHQGSVVRPKPELNAIFEEYDLARDGFIADRVLTRVMSPTKEGTLPILTREALTALNKTSRSPGAAYPRLDIQTEGKEFTVKDFGQEGKITDEDREWYSNVFDLEAAITKVTVHKIFMAHENTTASAVFDTAVWTGASLYTDISSSAPWDTEGSDVIGKLQLAIQKVELGTGTTPTSLIATKAALTGMLNINTAVARFMGTANPLPWERRLQILASIIGIDEIIVANGHYNSANEGQDFTGASFWDDDYVMVAKIGKTEDPKEPCIGRTVIWRPFGADLVSVGTYEEPQTSSTIVQVDSKYVEFIIDPAFGHLLKIDA